MVKRCSGVKARLVDTPDFKCNKHLQPPERNHTYKIKLGNVKYKIVYHFCYLGDMLSADCGAEVNSTTRVRTG